MPSKGDIVTLTSRNRKNISISAKRDSWVDEDIIKKVPTGTKAQVIERYEEAISPHHKFVRYKIKVDNTIGWVGEEDISF